ncbi:LacI family DNA-binding transcriptional regulator [Planctomicrobium sp. SH527]|uniref:LacI family DNA-binding transcriptional regulator n=1 Tax=Planctomicrobium sp. SH527 TaxID=3448123 RepID=UPI003F5C868B
MRNPIKKVRLIDIAKQAGVSRAAVGHVLNHSGQDNVRVSDETRARVLQIAKELEYRPNRAAQQLRGKPNHTFGVILDTVNLAVFSARLAAVEAEARRRGYRLMIGQVHHDHSEVEAYLDDFYARGIDAVLCLFDVMNDLRDELQSAFRNNSRAVIHASPILKTQPCVRVDTESAIHQLVDHLVERGRKKIGIQLWSPSDSLMGVRTESWKDAVEKHGLDSTEKLVWTNPQRTQRPTPEIIDECIQQLVFDQKADAILASNDEWAVRLIQGLRRRNLEVPRDVAVTGYDNLDIAEVVEPALTTIDQCHLDYAVAAVDLMQATLKGIIPAEDRIRVIKPRLVIRNST